jgi:hypothetical protein
MRIAPSSQALFSCYFSYAKPQHLEEKAMEWRFTCEAAGTTKKQKPAKKQPRQNKTQQKQKQNNVHRHAPIARSGRNPE